MRYCLFIFPTLLLAGWPEVQALPAGAKVQVVKRDKKSLHGDFVRASSDEVVLSTGTVPKTDVIRLSRSAGRTRNAIIGTAIGVAAGAAVGGLLRVRLNNETGNGDQALAGAVAVGGGVGAAIGASQVHFETLYRATP